MKTVRITLLGCLAAVWIVACGQHTTEPLSSASVDSLSNEDEVDKHAAVAHSPAARAVWNVLGKNPFNATKDELATVTHLPKVRGGAGFIDQHEINLLAACVNLVELDIEAMSLSNEQLAVLASLTKLESLKLFGNRITALSPIARLTNLRTLDISANPIADLQPVVELPNLTALSASDIGLTDIRPLAGLVNLRHLELWGNDIDDISPIAGLVNLQYLHLSTGDIDDLTPIAGLINLQHLNLKANAIDDLTPLVGLVQLETLNLNRNKIVDIQPLLDNIGIGAGDEIQLKANKLSDISRNRHVPALEARGVIVKW